MKDIAGKHLAQREHRWSAFPGTELAEDVFKLSWTDPLVPVGLKIARAELEFASHPNSIRGVAKFVQALSA